MGLTNPQIGERMFISKGTVRTHLTHIFTKLDVSTRSQLAAEATARENWNKLRDALALDKLHTFAWAGAFDGKDWSTRAFLSAPAPRKSPASPDSR